MALSFEQVDRGRTANTDRALQRTESDVLQMPDGFRAGGRLYVTSNKLYVSSININVFGYSVSIKTETQLSGENYVTAVTAGTMLYVYIAKSGEYYVDILAPIWNDDTYCYTHQSRDWRLIGQVYYDSNKNYLYPNSKYDEGVIYTIFLPTLTFGGGSTGITYSIQKGVIRRDEIETRIYIAIRLTSKGTDVGDAVVENIPIGSIGAEITPFTMYSNVAFSGQYTARVLSGTIGLIQSVEAGSVSFLQEADFANDTSVYIEGAYYTQ